MLILSMNKYEKHINPCHVEQIKMPHPLLVLSQSDYLVKVVDTNSNTEWQTADPDQLASSEAN